MGFTKKIDNIFKNAKVIEYDKSSKFVIMSDCHRGDGGLGDNFSRNQDIYFHALKYYYKDKYTYIELGDGDDLWEVKRISDIIENYSNIFWLLSKFYEEDRMYFIYGNHDMVKKDKKYIEKNYSEFFDEQKNCYTTLFKDIEINEGLILRDKESNNNIFLIHGHQGDFMNYNMWRFTRFLVRYIWRPLERYGVNDPTSTAKNYKKKIIIVRKFIEWAKAKKVMLIAGHTHKPMFPKAHDVPYFNDGSCIHPRCITAIEIESGRIQLIKWCIGANEDGTLAIQRSVLAGPCNISDYF